MTMMGLGPMAHSSGPNDKTTMRTRSLVVREMTADGKLAVADARRPALPPLQQRGYESVASFFAALADPTRIRIVHVLIEGEASTRALAHMLTVSDTRISQHLAVLRRQRFIASRREGRRVLHSVTDPRVREILEATIGRDTVFNGPVGRDR